MLREAFSTSHAGANSSRQRDPSKDRDQLIEWSRLNGFIINPEAFTHWVNGRESADLSFAGESSEVDVYRANAGYVIKVTKSDELGFDHFYGHAGPASVYLQWLENSNYLLGDTVEFHGIVQVGEAWKIVTSQQYIQPHHKLIPTESMIEQAMAGIGYKLSVLGLRAGYISTKNNVFIWDAGANNFILTPAEGLAPIDVHPEPLNPNETVNRGGS